MVRHDDPRQRVDKTQFLNLSEFGNQQSAEEQVNEQRLAVVDNDGDEVAAPRL